MTPDLDNDPMVLLAMAAVLGMIALALWLYERKHDAASEGQPGPDDDARAARAGGADHSENARADRGEPTHRDRLVHGRRGRERHRGRGRLGRLSSELDLSRAELLALARYLQLGYVGTDERPDLIAAINKTDSVARYWINAERSARR